jgi:hypothetical protein
VDLLHSAFSNLASLFYGIGLDLAKGIIRNNIDYGVIEPKKMRTKGGGTLLLRGCRTQTWAGSNNYYY